MTEFFKKNWKWIIFAAVILLAIFLRVWHFHDWLFFKMDQARDAFTAQQAYMNGPGYLPLLGPKAGGTKVNLGPIFYYFQYFSTVLFHSAAPPVMAYPDLLFSILAIPLLYIFLKKYFDRNWSMILAGLYALCFLGIEYSRFAWNPNSLPFFNLLFFYSLLNIFDPRYKYKLRWYILAGLAFSISTQLHFLSFFTLPLLTLIFLFFNRKELKKTLEWKKILVFVAIVLVIYVPVFANELHSNFRDSKAFLDALHSKASDHGIFKNILRDFVYFGVNWITILTGLIRSKKETLVPLLAWLLFVLPALLLNWKYYKKEKDPLRKKFLLITLIWLPIYFLGYIPIAYQIRPRFFLPMLALPFIFLGYICQYFTFQKKIWAKYIPAALVVIVLFGNSYGTYAWLKEMKDAQKRGVYPKRTIILKSIDGITLWHLENSANYIAANCSQNVVYFNSSSEYHRPIKYLLGLKGKNGLSLVDAETGDPNACYFGIKRTRVKDNNLGDPLDSEFYADSEKKFGAMSVLTLKLNDNFSGQALPTFHKSVDELQNPDRVFWKDIFSKVSKKTKNSKN
ncbi:MAG: glycosyltransferase family 39 protein [Candidatus Moranbacteria bacterium]|nr:glycosyltransferase family 39 protein [Candidatus Moranbacteria bacterium]